MEKTYIWRILHKPTGLFYCSRKGRWKDTITNLSNKGNFYDKESYAVKVLKDIGFHCCINETQVKKHKLTTHTKNYMNSFSYALPEDFEIIKYSLEIST